MKILHHLFPRCLALMIGAGSWSLYFASAASLTWDSNAVIAPNPSDGSGTWTNPDSWWDGTANVSWTPANVAVFGAGTDGTYTVDVSGLPYPGAQSIQFSNSGYALIAASPATIALSSTTGSTASQLRVTAGKIAAIGTNVTVQESAATFLYIGAPGQAAGGTLNIENGGIVRNTNANFTCLIDGAGTVVNVMAGGTLAHVGAGNQFCSVGQQAGASCTLNIQGGTWSSGASGPLAGLVVGQLGIGVVNLNSGTVIMGTGATTIGLTLGNNTSGDGTFNLNGGALSATLVRKGTAGVNGGGTNSVFNFNGGTLKALINQPSFMIGLTKATVQSGGAFIDDNGFAITIGQALVAGAPSGGLAKLGSGTLTLAGVNTYSGGTDVNKGILALGATGSMVNSTNINLAKDATLDVTAVTGFALNASQGLSGGGTLLGSIMSSGTIRPGINAIGTLTFSTAPGISGKVISEIDRNAIQRADKIAITDATTLSYGGLLEITNIGGTLHVGDVFKLFDAVAYAGSFSSITYPAGYTFTNKLLLDGTVEVLTAPSQSPKLTYAVSGPNWVFSWVGGGFKLQSQTNTFGIGTNWSDVPGGNVSGVIMPAPVSTNPPVFFRLISTP